MRDGTLKAYHSRIFLQYLIVLADGRHINQGVDIFETMDPFFALRSLSADVDNSAKNTVAL